MLHISDGERIGYLVLSVTIRKESTEMISTLRDCGVQSVLLTGDNENSANSIAKQLGISEVYPVLQCVAFAGPAGPAFLFLPALCPCLNFHQREARCFSAGKDGYFVFEGFSRQLPLATAAHNWLTRPQRGRSGASLVLFSPPSIQNRTQALTGPSLGVTVFYSRSFSAVVLSVGAPGGNSPPREWVGSYKVASRFSRSRPMSTQWSAGLR